MAKQTKEDIRLNKNLSAEEKHSVKLPDWVDLDVEVKWQTGEVGMVTGINPGRTACFVEYRTIRQRDMVFGVEFEKGLLVEYLDPIAAMCASVD